MKHCSKCRTTKPLHEFSKDARSRDGLQNNCKICKKAANVSWRIENPHKANAYRPTEARREYGAKYRAANREKARIVGADWREKNREKARAASSRWAKLNPESTRVYNSNYRARKCSNGDKLSVGISEKLLILQRGKCACGCRQPLGENYHLDHIMPLALGGPNTDDNIQLLRQFCNNQKHNKHPIDYMQSKGYLL